VRSDYNYGYKSDDIGIRGGSKKPSSWGFIFPFLFFIAIGIMLVIGFDIYTKFSGVKLEDVVMVSSVSGDVDVKVWGVSEFSEASSGVTILQGDELRTFVDSSSVVEFPNGVSISLNADTGLVFDGIAEDYTSILNLLSGSVNVAGYFSGKIVAGSIEVQPSSDDFEVKFDGVESFIKVITGSVDISVYGEDGVTVVDHVAVMAGEEALFDKEKLQRFWEHQAPNVVEKTLVD